LYSLIKPEDRSASDALLVEVRGGRIGSWRVKAHQQFDVLG
jgi:hypothetical protein